VYTRKKLKPSNWGFFINISSVVVNYSRHIYMILLESYKAQTLTMNMTI
jgi:hypothetical protein